MLDDIRPLARCIHLAFSLLAALVVYLLTWYMYSDGKTAVKRWSVLVPFFFACAAGVAMHYWLDWVVGVP